MPIGQSRPLHRLTQLGEDPASEWLSTGQRLQVILVGAMAWVAFVGFLWLFRVVLILVLSQTLHAWGRLPSVLSGMLGAALAAPLKRAVLRLKSDRAAALIKQDTRDARPIDDWSELESQPDGLVVSVVGWIRGRLDIECPVNGEPCVGLALPCQDKYPGVLQTMHDFELVNEEGRALAIRVADGRLLGRPNVRLNGAHDHRLLIASLDLPSGAFPASMSAFVLRNGDPIMVVGFKQTVRDPDVYEARQSCLRPALGSGLPRPLLIFPLVAERRTR